MVRFHHQVTQWALHVCKDVATDSNHLSQQLASFAIEEDQFSLRPYKTGVLSAKCGTKLDHGVVTSGEQGHTSATLCPKSSRGDGVNHYTENWIQHIPQYREFC